MLTLMPCIFSMMQGAGEITIKQGISASGCRSHRTIAECYLIPQDQSVLAKSQQQQQHYLDALHPFNDAGCWRDHNKAADISIVMPVTSNDRVMLSNPTRSISFGQITTTATTLP